LTSTAPLSQHNPFHLIKRYLILRAIIELGGARTGMGGHELCLFERSAGASRKTLRMPRRLRRGGMSNLGSGLDARYPDRFLFLFF
jgi:hypothetical protein